MTAERPRIGIVGTGWWATQAHLPALIGYDGAEVTAIADADPRQLAAAASASTSPHAFDDPARAVRLGTRRRRAHRRPARPPLSARQGGARRRPARDAREADGARVRPCVGPRRDSRVARAAPDGRLHVPVHPRCGTRRRAGRIRTHRRAAPRLRAVRLDGRVVLPRPARRLRGRLPVPGDRARRRRPTPIRRSPAAGRARRRSPTRWEWCCGPPAGGSPRCPRS